MPVAKTNDIASDHSTNKHNRTATVEDDDGKENNIVMTHTGPCHMIRRRQSRKHGRRYGTKHSGLEQQSHPPWIQKKKNNKNNKNNNKHDNLVSRYVKRRQEETWNEFAHDALDPLFPNKKDDALLHVMECLYYMGIGRSILEHAAHVIVSDDNDHDNYPESLSCLAQYLAYGVTRVPTPFGISQRLTLLHVICTFREKRRFFDQNSNNVDTVEEGTIDPVLLWHFLMGEDDDDDDGTGEEAQETAALANNKYIWKTGEDTFYLWCWELRALTLAYLAKEEEERQLAHSTADELSHAVGMAAVAVELGLNESTELVCQGIGHGCDWIKHQLGSPKVDSFAVAAAAAEGDQLEEEWSHNELDNKGQEEAVCHVYWEDGVSEEASTSSVISSAALSGVTGETSGSANSQGGSTANRKTKEGIVKDTYTSYSRNARQATEAARHTTQTYVENFKEASGQKLHRAAQSSRAWATEHVHANQQHWAYLDAFAQVSLASLGAVVVMGEAMFRNTHVVLDHTATVTSDLIEHRFGPTAAHVFDDVSRATTNVTRMTAQVAGLASPTLITKAVVKHASKERLRKQQAHDEQNDLTKQQQEPTSQQHSL